MNKDESMSTDEVQPMPLLSLLFYRTCNLADQQQDQDNIYLDNRKDKDTYRDEGSSHADYTNRVQ